MKETNALFAFLYELKTSGQRSARQNLKSSILNRISSFANRQSISNFQFLILLIFFLLFLPIIHNTYAGMDNHGTTVSLPSTDLDAATRVRINKTYGNQRQLEYDFAGGTNDRAHEVAIDSSDRIFTILNPRIFGSSNPINIADFVLLKAEC